MPDEVMDAPAETPQGTTDAGTHAEAAADEQVASEQETTAGSEGGSGDVDVQALQKEIADLKKLKGKMGQELGEYRKRHGKLYGEETAEASDDLMGDLEPGDEPAEEPAADAGSANEKYWDKMLAGKDDEIDQRFVEIAKRATRELLTQDKREQSERSRCIKVHGEELVSKHDGAVRKLLKEKPSLGYRAAFLVAANADMLAAAREQGALEKERELTAGNGGRVATGGRPTRPNAPPDFRKALRDAYKVTPTEESGDFAKL